MSAERCDGKPRTSPPCCWYDEDYDDATDPAPMPKGCNEPATHWSCNYSIVPGLNVCKKHSCRCAQPVNDATDEASGPSLNADHAALMAAHAAGYAAAVTDVVAWLEARYGRLRSYTYGDADERTIMEALASDIKDGAHIGAAKKGAT